jgi:hypothetical protein
MTKFIHIYDNDDVSRWNVQYLKLKNVVLYSDLTEFEAIESSDKISVFQLPYPFSDPKEFDHLLNRAVKISKLVVVLVSELHDTTVDFCSLHPHPKVKYFLCGYIENFSSSQWMDWFSGTTHFYKHNKHKVLDRLVPFQSKPKVFDILLGQNRRHRDIIYNYINTNNLNDHVILTYKNHTPKLTFGENSDTWIWEDEGLEIIDTDLKWTVSQVRYYGQQMSLSQVVPINIYNQTAYSVVAETNFSSNFVFHTEKIVKPILARRMFIVFGGRYYLKNLQRLGFKTFDGIIDESYDNEIDYQIRGRMICEQIQYLINQPQEEILDKIKPIVEHNKEVMLETDWLGNFSRELRAVLLSHIN